MRNPKDYFLLYLKGLAMGGADTVPGVSGGTIAFISGIYEELIDSISAINLEALQLLKDGRIAAFWKHINGTFLVVLLAGILTSILTLSRLITYLLEEHPIALWSFFFGLIVISSLLIIREIKQWNLRVVLAGLVGIAIAVYISLASPSETPTALWFIFVAGMVAICAMILPGISGAFILLLFGKYQYILTAVHEFKFTTLLVFALGCITGLLSFSRLVSWLLDNYYNTAVSLLAGFMVGSLVKIWPWKVVTQYYLNSEGIQKPLITKSVLPTTFQQITGEPPLLLLALLFMALGILLVVGLERISKHHAGPGKHTP
jgi:putative membrane protein